MSLGCPDMAADAINRLREKGLEPSLDHIATLIELAKRIQEPSYRTFPWLSYHGVQVGESSRRLRPLTIKSGIWFDYIVDHLVGEERHIACAIAMEFGHDPEFDFRELFDTQKARNAIAKYKTGLEFTFDELEDAILRCTDESLEADRMSASTNTKNTDIENTIAQLVAMTGIEEEHWMSHTIEFSMKVLTHAITKGQMFASESNGDDYQKLCWQFNCEALRIERELVEAKSNV
ncbi:MAG: hypothetical protein ACPHEP_04445 [Acidimicrobiales bacterium]